MKGIEARAHVTKNKEWLTAHEFVTPEEVMVQLALLEDDYPRSYFPIPNISKGLLLRKGRDHPCELRYGEGFVREIVHCLIDLDKVEEACLVTDARPESLKYDQLGYSRPLSMRGYRIKLPAQSS